MPMLKPE
ncbi:hypothetical protein A6R68_04176 [Neotoma lepida]|nr:hypothetical protein A6R68_04176 [Neotoma lepida]